MSILDIPHETVNETNAEILAETLPLLRAERDEFLGMLKHIDRYLQKRGGTDLTNGSQLHVEIKQLIKKAK